MPQISVMASLSLEWYQDYSEKTRIAMREETLSIVQFLRLIDRDGIGQSQNVIHNSFFSCQGGSTQQDGCRHGGYRA